MIIRRYYTDLRIKRLTRSYYNLFITLHIFLRDYTLIAIGNLAPSIP